MYQQLYLLLQQLFFYFVFPCCAQNVKPETIRITRLKIEKKHVVHVNSIAQRNFNFVENSTTDQLMEHKIFKNDQLQV